MAMETQMPLRVRQFLMSPSIMVPFRLAPDIILRAQTAA
jgi:hypothetical protein